MFAARCYLPQSIRGLRGRRKKGTGTGEGEKRESGGKGRELSYEGIRLRVDNELTRTSSTLSPQSPSVFLPPHPLPLLTYSKQRMNKINPGGLILFKC